MLNKIFTIVIMMSFGSFLLSDEVVKISDKEKSKIEKKQISKIEKKQIKKELKKLKQIVKKKKRPGKIKSNKNSERRQQIQLLKKQYQSRKLEISNRYRTRIERLKKLGSNSTLVNSNSKLIKQLKSELRMELETLEKNTKHRLSEIENS